MNFSGTFELDDTTVEEVWLALSDPAMIRSSLPGCQFLYRVEDDAPDFDALRERAQSEDQPEPTGDPDVINERAFVEGGHYAALMQIGVGSVKPTFETVVTIDRRDEPEMEASGEGSAGDSSFEMSSWMGLEPTDDGGVAVDWRAEADVFGRIANMGQRVMNPVANRVVKRFFSSIQTNLQELTIETETETETGADTEAQAGSDPDGDPATAAADEESARSVETEPAGNDEKRRGGLLSRLLGRIRGMFG
jgi:hypothetical protein